jgi:hypothetical protein
MAADGLQTPPFCERITPICHLQSAVCSFATCHLHLLERHSWQAAAEELILFEFCANPFKAPAHTAAQGLSLPSTFPPPTIAGVIWKGRHSMPSELSSSNDGCGSW